MGAGEAPPPPLQPGPAPRSPLPRKRGEGTTEGEEEGRGGSYSHLSAPPAASRRPWLPGVPRSLRLPPRVSRGPERLPPPPRRPPPPSHTLRHAGDRGGHRREPGEASERARPRERAPPRAATTSPPTWRPARHRAHAPRRRPRARRAPRPGARERVRGGGVPPGQGPRPGRHPPLRLPGGGGPWLACAVLQEEWSRPGAADPLRRFESVPFASCVMLSNFLSLSEPYFPGPCNEGTSVDHPVQLLGELSVYTQPSEYA